MSKLTSTQKIIALVVAVLAIIAIVFCIFKFTSKDENTDKPVNEEITTQEITDSKDNITEEKVTKETTEKSTKKTNKNLKATDSDFKILTDFLADFMNYTDEYDYKSSDAKETAFTSLMCSHFTSAVYRNFFNDYKEIYEYGDPLGRFTIGKGFSSYFVFPGKSMDWIISNVFNLTPDHNYKNDWAYYKDGNYYVGLIPSGGDFYELSVTKSTQIKDNLYEIIIKCDYYCMGDEYPTVYNYKVTAELCSYNEKRYWSLYKFSEITSTSQNSVQQQSESWKTAYNKYLKSVYDEVAGSEQYWLVDDMYFSFAYIDSDDIPELLISEGTYNAAQVMIATYKNGKVVDLGKYGSMGYVSYVEKGSVIFSGYYTQGRVSEAYYKINSNGSAEKILSAFSNAASGDPLMYKINDVEVTKEEYEYQLSKMPQNLTPSELSYSFTYENFDQYCK